MNLFALALTIAVFGDAPYGTSPTDDAEFQATPKLIQSINDDPEVRWVLHVGDIHSGKQYCTEAYDRSIFELWKAFEDPLVYTPGDNEWTDCNKSTEGGHVLDASGNPVDYANGDPLANLDLVRRIFFAHPGVTLGRHKRMVLSQAMVASDHPTDLQYVENVMWMEADVLFVAVNLPGGSNDDADPWFGLPLTAAQSEEMTNRNGADLRWLELAFGAARLFGAEAMVIETQADMWDPEKGAAHLTNYEPIISAIAEGTQAFGRPVLLLNGDSHVYLSDNPLSADDPLAYLHAGYDVPNFHRIVVHGSTFPLEWLKLTIGKRGEFGPFSWQRMIQP